MKNFNRYLPKSLTGRLIFLPTISIFIIFIVIGSLSGFLQYKYLYKNLVHNTSILQKELTTSVEKFLLLEDYSEAEAVMLQFCQLDEIRSIALIDHQGNSIIIVDKPDPEVMPNVLYGVSLQYSQDIKGKKIAFHLDQAHTIVFYNPISHNNTHSWIRVEASKLQVYTHLVNLIGFGGFIVLFFTLVLGYFVIKISHEPLMQIDRIKNFATSLNESTGSTLACKTSILEIEELTYSLNQLSITLLQNRQTMNSQNEELQKFNNELTQRVQEEINKNRHKEVMLLKQSRLVALGEMIGNIAHQWRQPLNVIAIGIQNLQLSYQLNELTEDEFDESAEIIMKQIYDLSNTIDNFSDIVNDNQAIEPFIIANAIYKSVDIVSASLKQFNISVQYDMDESLVLSRGSRNSFSQVIMNILNNSKDAFEQCEAIQNKVIMIKVYKHNAAGVIMISDNGGGISETIIEKVFDPYFTTKHQSKGTGLGLYITKNIIEKEFEGTLSVNSIDHNTFVRIECPIELV